MHIGSFCDGPLSLYVGGIRHSLNALSTVMLFIVKKNLIMDKGRKDKMC